MGIFNEKTLISEKYCYPCLNGAFASHSWCGEFLCRNDFVIEREKETFTLLIYTLQGEGELIINNKIYRMQKNTLAVLPTNLAYRYSAVGDGWRFKFAHIHGEAAPTLAREIVSIRGYVFDYFDVSNYFYKLINAAKNLSSSFVASRLTYSLLLSATYGDASNVDNPVVLSAVKYIQDNLNGDLSIETIANAVSLSRPYFTQLFTKIVGESPSFYIVKERLKRAKHLLYTTDKTVGEIALSCGYYDVSSFIRLFKKHEGVSPLEYRKNNPL